MPFSRVPAVLYSLQLPSYSTYRATPAPDSPQLPERNPLDTPLAEVPSTINNDSLAKRAKAIWGACLYDTDLHIPSHMCIFRFSCQLSSLLLFPCRRASSVFFPSTSSTSPSLPALLGEGTARPGVFFPDSDHTDMDHGYSQSSLPALSYYEEQFTHTKLVCIMYT